MSVTHRLDVCIADCGVLYYHLLRITAGQPIPNWAIFFPYFIVAKQLVHTPPTLPFFEKSLTFSTQPDSSSQSRNGADYANSSKTRVHHSKAGWPDSNTSPPHSKAQHWPDSNINVAEPPPRREDASSPRSRPDDNTPINRSHRTYSEPHVSRNPQLLDIDVSESLPCKYNKCTLCLCNSCRTLCN